VDADDHDGRAVDPLRSRVVHGAHRRRTRRMALRPVGSGLLLADPEAAWTRADTNPAGQQRCRAVL